MYENDALVIYLIDGNGEWIDNNYTYSGIFPRSYR